MSVTREIIDALLARMRAAFPNLAVEHFPEKPDTYILNHTNGALLLDYGGSDFKRTDGAYYISQTRQLKFAVITVLRHNYRTPDGIATTAEVLDELRICLTGYAPPHCKKIWLVRENFIKQEAGLWYYTLLFTTETEQVEAVAEPDPAPPLLTKVTHEYAPYAPE